MRSTNGFIPVLIAALLITSGCASDDTTSPITPCSLSETPPGMQNVSEVSRTETIVGSHRMWGLYGIFIEADSTATVIPARIATGHLNARRFLEEYPCASCLVVHQMVLVGPKEWMVDVQLRHPFVGHNYYTGFDVRGIVMFDSTYTFPGTGLSYPDPNEETGGGLLNADGYTDLFNPIDYPPGSAAWPALEYQKGKFATPDFPDSRLNPFKEYNATEVRRMFGCSEADTQTFHIRFPEEGPLHFGYAVDACWVPPVADPPMVPDDFPLEANRPEPYFLAMQVTQNTLWSEPGIGGGGNIHFILKVYDHQDPHLVEDGGTIEGFRWEIPGMTGWVSIEPQGWSEGIDSMGQYVAYFFNEAPVPDTEGPHKLLLAVEDLETGLLGTNERAFVVTNIGVAPGETCWSPGELMSDNPSENLMSYLNNARTTFIDEEGILHLFFLDNEWEPHHLTWLDGLLSDEEYMPGATAYNLNAVPDSEGGIHTVYSDDPDSQGGNIVYVYISPEGQISDGLILSAQPRINQFQSCLAIAPDGTILALWMNSKPQPDRRLCGAYFNGTDWTPEMILRICYLPSGWTNHYVIADSASTFHIVTQDDEPPNLYYMQFDTDSIVLDEPLVIGDWRSVGPIMSIDEDDRIYMTFMDTRAGSYRGFLMMRDPVSGVWTPAIDMVGYNHYNNRYQNAILPDGRLAVIWTDRRDNTRGLYSKVFDPFLTEDEIQATPDDEIDSQFDAEKNQTRLCIDEGGTLHLVWSDHRTENHWQLYYSQCTP